MARGSCEFSWTTLLVFLKVYIAGILVLPCLDEDSGRFPEEFVAGTDDERVSFYVQDC